MNEYQNLSEIELQVVIDKAEKALKEKQIGKRKEVIAEIKELASSIGVTVTINESEKKIVKTGKKIAAKYRNPDDSTQTWTGRGVSPKWVRELIEAGHDKSKFLI